MKSLNNAFTRFANKASELTGSSWAFLAAVTVIVIWAISGPFFGLSDTWQLIINTFTTLVTFLMVFLIQNTQNRDSKALHLKLDEIIHVIGAAHDELIDVEDLTDEELQDLIKQYRRLAHQPHRPGATGSAAAGHQGGALPSADAELAASPTDQDGAELVLAGTPAAAPSSNGRHR